MLDAQYDLTAIGLPFIDIIAQVDDSFLQQFGIFKGTVRDIQPAHLLAVRSELTNYTIFPGGSPPNTCAGIHALGGKAVFLGRVADDVSGRAFRNAFPPGNVVFPNQPYGTDAKAASGTVIVLVTPDDVTTIVANPGIGDILTERDIFPELIKDSKILYLQAHFLLVDASKDAAEKAIDVAKQAKREVAFSLHGHRKNAERAALFIDRHLAKADILIGNRNEFELLFRPFDAEKVKKGRQLMIVTDGAKGAHIVGRGEMMHIPPHMLKARDNSVGAGDAYAAGFFYGYVRGLKLQDCGELGAEAANEILDIPGARPIGSWGAMAEKYLQKAPTSIRNPSVLNPGEQP
jgi:sugar/nucleoside kinase (ribokinase family)